MSIPRIDRAVHLSYKDILLVPYDDDFCTIASRNDPDISTEVCPGKSIKIPLISSPMDSITGSRMAIALGKEGCLGIHTRFINKEHERAMQLEEMETVCRSDINPIACAIGVKADAYSSAHALCELGTNIICLDIANGNHSYMRRALNSLLPLKETFDISFIAGNVATPQAAVRLAKAGADAIKIGIGPGAACTTRRVVGFGVPQFTAIVNCDTALRSAGYRDKVRLIADGGVRTSGDIIKALWAGADSVMCGYIFAGCDECPTFNGKRMYRGMSSRTVSSRNDVAPEGICFDAEAKGPVSDVISQYAAAIRAACSMANANNLNELRRNVKAIRVSTMSNEESEPIPGNFME